MDEGNKWMSIWKRHMSLEQLNKTSKATLMAQLGIVYTKITDQSLIATMPVDKRTHQPLGILHGGASVALAETLASLAGNLCVSEEEYCLGLEINANHIRSMRTGMVTGTATPVHLGNKTQVWQVEVADEQGRLLSISRSTLSILKRK